MQLVRIRTTSKADKVPINAVTGEVGPSTKMSRNPTGQLGLRCDAAREMIRASASRMPSGMTKTRPSSKLILTKLKMTKRMSPISDTARKMASLEACRAHITPPTNVAAAPNSSTDMNTAICISIRTASDAVRRLSCIQAKPATSKQRPIVNTVTGQRACLDISGTDADLDYIPNSFHEKVGNSQGGSVFCFCGFFAVELSHLCRHPSIRSLL
jgi:hypothetical protein